MINESAHGAAIEKYFKEKGGTKRRDRRAFSGRAVIMCYTNRCGSTYVASELSRMGVAGNPNTRLNYEFFASDYVTEYAEVNRIYSLDEYVVAISKEFASPLGCFFTKVSPDQFHWLVRMGVVGTIFTHPTVMVVRRRNKIAQAVSMAIAIQTNHWTSLHPRTSVEPNFDQDLIVGYAKNVVALEAQLELLFDILNIAPVECIYEDVVSDRRDFTSRIELATGLRSARTYRSTLPVAVQGTSINVQWEERVRVSLRESLLRPGDRVEWL